ncbi:hypothetical protein LUZ61_013912 [Rhynchospora tenuis]|uniref:Uncharacterized protein n=1 Tax=Rhynchospora tenuis TaxID=198213 RepID=A0AAD5WBE8_9POAL|nr:hypothetical protein LUZ61_013912 [Rhynchospora tenuis]
MTDSTSATKRKKKGDRGSPCRNPLLCLKVAPNNPLIKTAELEVDKIDLTQLTYFERKPLCNITGNKNSQLTDSNALKKSSFMRIAGLVPELRWQRSNRDVDRPFGPDAGGFGGERTGKRDQKRKAPGRFGKPPPSPPQSKRPRKYKASD